MTLTQEQGQALYMACEVISASYKSLEQAGKITSDNWFGMWQAALVTKNGVARMLEGKESPHWPDISFVCTLATEIIGALPAAHNARDLAPIHVLNEIRAVADSRSAA